MSEFFSGWDPTKEDWDAIEAMPEGIGEAATAAPMPKEIRKPSEWLRVERQVRNDCQGNSLSSGVECCRYYASGGSDIVQLSRHFAYIGTQRYQGGDNWNGHCSDNGSTIAGGVRLAHEVGLCHESVYPYPSQFTCNIERRHIDDAKENRVEDFRRLRTPDEAMQILETGTGVVHAGVRWGSGYHAIEYLEVVNGQPKFVNSWGESWSNDGWEEDTYSEFKSRWNDRYAVFIGISGIKDFRPPVWDPRKDGLII